MFYLYKNVAKFTFKFICTVLKILIIVIYIKKKTQNKLIQYKTRDFINLLIFIFYNVVILYSIF